MSSYSGSSQQQAATGRNEESTGSMPTGEMASSRSLSAGWNPPPPRSAQAGFVQKLYNMLEDRATDKFIWWSESNESFMVNPDSEFQTILSNYFKHTNPQSFVRQLNMYGFHKVNDVFQSVSNDAHTWEFKHGENKFRRGDRESLREVKRRPSKHGINREAHRMSVPYFEGPPLNQQSGGPQDAGVDTVESRLTRLEHQNLQLFDVWRQSDYERSRLATRCEVLTDCIVKSQRLSHDLINLVKGFSQDQGNPLLLQAASTQSEIDERLGQLQSFGAAQASFDRRQSATSSNWDSVGGTLSPYQGDSRRQSLAPNSNFRSYANRSAATSPNRYDSISNAVPSNMMDRAQASYVPPLTADSSHQQAAGGDPSANMGRRHTSADIRETAAWRSNFSSSEHLPIPNANHYSSYGSTNNSGHWPPSPGSRSSQTELQLRDTLGRYQIDSRNPSTASDATVTHSSYQLPGHNGQASGGLSQPGMGLFNNVQEGHVFNQPSSVARNLFTKDPFADSGASTRRSSMAHILNPADTAERADEDDVAPDERSKRKRLG